MCAGGGIRVGTVKSVAIGDVVQQGQAGACAQAKTGRGVMGGVRGVSVVIGGDWWRV